MVVPSYAGIASFETTFGNNMAEQILKVGVTVQRYVSFRNARPWVTHAYKNVKGRGVRQTTQVDDLFDADSQLLQESLAKPLGYLDTSPSTPGSSGDATPAPSSTHTPPYLPASDKELTSDNKDQISRSDEVIAKSSRTKPNNSGQQDLTEKGDNSDLPASNVEVKGNQPDEGSLLTNTDRPRRGREQRKSVKSDGPLTPQPISTYQRVRLLCSPLRKPEGNINKPLFKTMVESMMQKIMASPGISFQTLCENYTPYNPPFLKLQILEILEDIKAVKKSILRQQIKPTLFSKRVSPQLVTIDKDDDTVVYFPTEVCITKLGQFMEAATRSRLKGYRETTRPWTLPEKLLDSENESGDAE
ncbi:general transcription factor 3C polypeptide 1-like [Pecten maximus]|uniref:general transcription factor 3C polypeptide 1-like n=1 Tax=Pecten maximus TaxID=6579 RepID=UPI0014589747|nr:general transcription factor 3C polypeptide 1-like [Pecten maximus]